MAITREKKIRERTGDSNKDSCGGSYRALSAQGSRLGFAASPTKLGVLYQGPTHCGGICFSGQPIASKG
ncbi:hypothetical protein Scep_016314 [Stephania cephalantha]|uniref:Uncharacterized protein n=1 Tax=Stephania cephalantha TaxID=152367 RepID=A0AAP0IMG0_9MAGN